MWHAVGGGCISPRGRPPATCVKKNQPDAAAMCKSGRSVSLSSRNETCGAVFHVSNPFVCSHFNVEHAIEGSVNLCGQLKLVAILALWCTMPIRPRYFPSIQFIRYSVLKV
jgi:hypothetical protein